MDMLKIGKFIARLRKERNITQQELAEKLDITDRAVSKWERGLSLPDAGKMLELCNILNINVNELLLGEKMNINDYNNKTDQLLVELSRQEENKNKIIMTTMWILVITTMVFYIGILLLAVITLEEGTILGGIIVVSTLITVAVAFYGLKLEVDAGYYECKNCHHKFVPTYFKALIAPHKSTTRYLKCPKCNKRTWSKKTMNK